MSYKTKQLMSWNNLPSELSQVIFSYLTRKELVQCQLTCFGWSRQAQQALYKDVQIESSHQLFSFINAISTSNMQPGHYLRKLYLNCCFDHELTNNTLDILTKHSASIEHLQLITASDLFWHRLIQERKKGQWKHLRMVDFPLSRSQLKLYYEAMIVMQDTVESLMICDSFFLDYPTVNLHIFVRAKKLTLIKSTQMPLRELSQVVDVLPQLTDLTVKSSPQFPDVHHLSDHDYQALSWTPSKLVRLQTNLFQCSNETFLYMMEKFPNLMDFSIDFFSHPVSATPCLDLEVMKRFADYVCRLETFRVRQLVSENLADIIVLMIKQLKKRHVKFNVSVDVHSNQTRFRELYICYKKKEINSLCKPEVNLCIKNKNRLLPLASILQTIGSFVTSLRIYNVGTSLICFVPKQAEYHQVVDHHYLSDILEQCPQLTRLKLNRVRLIASDFEGHHLLDTLVLNRCVYSPLILYQLSKQSTLR